MSNQAANENTESGRDLPDPDTNLTGPVISMPNTSTSGGAPFITTASPATIMGMPGDESHDLGRSVAAKDEEATQDQLVETATKPPRDRATVEQHEEVERRGERDAD